MQCGLIDKYSAPNGAIGIIAAFTAVIRAVLTTNPKKD
jgi:hypothetical protein